jgi:hypothetical protein
MQQACEASHWAFMCPSCFKWMTVSQVDMEDPEPEEAVDLDEGIEGGGGTVPSVDGQPIWEEEDAEAHLPEPIPAGLVKKMSSGKGKGKVGKGKDMKKGKNQRRRKDMGKMGGRDSDSSSKHSSDSEGKGGKSSASSGKGSKSGGMAASSSKGGKCDGMAASSSKGGKCDGMAASSSKGGTFGKGNPFNVFGEGTPEMEACKRLKRSLGLPTAAQPPKLMAQPKKRPQKKSAEAAEKDEDE